MLELGLGLHLGVRGRVRVRVKIRVRVSWYVETSVCECPELALLLEAE